MLVIAVIQGWMASAYLSWRQTYQPITILEHSAGEEIYSLLLKGLECHIGLEFV